MANDFFYMLGIVAVGFALNFGLRALPFVLFGSRKGELPPWVERFGRFVSPVIIAGLIVYSYAGLACRTPWPYVAGVVTIALQVWRRNPLASIVVGTVLYMCLVNCGCTTDRVVEFDARNPAFTYTEHGVYFAGEQVEILDVPDILEDLDIPKDRTIHILLDPEVKDLRAAQFLMATLAKAGYRRPVLVTQRHAESINLGKRKPQTGGFKRAPTGKKVIRYKKASE